MLVLKSRAECLKGVPESRSGVSQIGQSNDHTSRVDEHESIVPTTPDTADEQAVQYPLLQSGPTSTAPL